MLFEDLVKEPEHALQSVFSWLGVDPTFEPEKIHAQRSGKPVSKKIMRVINNDSLIKRYTKKILPSLLRIKMRDHLYKTILKKEKMDERIRDILKIIYSEEVNQLEKMISMDLSTWK